MQNLLSILGARIVKCVICVCLCVCASKFT